MHNLATDPHTKTRPVRIAHVVEATTGGVARHLMDLTAHLDPAEFATVLYLSFTRPESWTEQLRGFARAQNFLLREIPLAGVHNQLLVARLREWMAQDAIDLLHLHSAKAGYLGRLAARGTDIPTIYTPHAFPFQRTTDWFRFLYRRIERKLAAETAGIICVSAGEAEEALDAGLPEEKLVVIPNGLDIDAWPLITPEQRAEARTLYGIAPEEMVVGALARVTTQKGFDLLLQAAEETLFDFPTSRVIIWGDGPQRRALRRLAKRLRLPRVEFLRGMDDPHRTYAAMDVYCAPSRWEAGPYGVLEAMACGLPIVASNVSGHVDYLVDEVNAKLFEADLPGPLAGVLHAMLADQDVRDAFGAAARRHVEATFPLSRMVEATAAVYRAVVAGKR